MVKSEQLRRGLAARGPLGGRIALRRDTHINHLGETNGPPFLIPAPGAYSLEIVLYARTRLQILDVSAIAFEVKPAS